jgi:hypothetical protein
MRDPVQEIGVTSRDTPFFTSAYGSYQTWGMLVEQTTISAGRLVLHGSSAPWVIDAAKKLEAIGRLSTGWDSYGGAPLDPDAKRLTVNALGWLENDYLPVPAVVLGSSGSVQLEWRANGRELEVELDKNGIEFVKIHADSTIEEGEEKANLPQELQRLTWWLMHG